MSAIAAWFASRPGRGPVGPAEVPIETTGRRETFKIAPFRCPCCAHLLIIDRVDLETGEATVIEAR